MINVSEIMDESGQSICGNVREWSEYPTQWIGVVRVSEAMDRIAQSI